MITAIEEKVRAGDRITDDDALALFASQDIHALGRMSRAVGERFNADRAYFINNRQLNFTNVCTVRCRFCAFRADEGDGRDYTMSMDDIVARVQEAVAAHATEIHIVNGLHPTLPFEFYLDVLRTLKAQFPELHLKAYTAVEIDHFCDISGLPLDEVIRRLKEAGLGSCPGGGAEIFAEQTRRKICAEKSSADRWLEIHRELHRQGIQSNATMLYGHIESIADRVDHMRRIRDLQDDTGGFMTFIPLALQPENHRIRNKSLTTGLDDLRTHTIARIYLDNVPHIKAYWVMLGDKMAQVAISFGIDDIDGTIQEERIGAAAGSHSEDGMMKDDLIALIRAAGRRPVQRDTVYNIVQEF